MKATARWARTSGKNLPGLRKESVELSVKPGPCDRFDGGSSSTVEEIGAKTWLLPN